VHQERPAEVNMIIDGWLEELSEAQGGLPTGGLSAI
jgi:hypothetical protein